MPCTRRRRSTPARSGMACCRTRRSGPGRCRGSDIAPPCSPGRSTGKATWRCSSTGASPTATAGRFPPGSSLAALASIFRSTTKCLRPRCSTSSPSPRPLAGRSTGRPWRGSIPSAASCSRPRATSSRSPRPPSDAARSWPRSPGSNGRPTGCRRSRDRRCRGSSTGRRRGLLSGGWSFLGWRPKTACGSPTCRSTAIPPTPGCSPATGSRSTMPPARRSTSSR